MLFLYEGSCCASIPIIRNLEEYYDNDLLTAVEGIFNGSTNYILSKIFNENIGFDEALKQAQDKGFAESNPSLDIEAFDPKYKLCIILLHTFELLVQPKEVFNYGIQNLSDFDIEYARQRKKKIKLVAHCRKKEDGIIAYCLPHFLNGNSKLTQVENEYNGVLVESAFSEQQFFMGKGAGGNPTGSAVLSDISALTYGYKYEYKKRSQQPAQKLNNEGQLDIYLRFTNSKIIDSSLFDSISQRYESEDNNYIIGKVNLLNLEKAEWLFDKEIFFAVNGN